MLESKAVAGWRREGELKGLLRAKRDAIMKCVKIRFPDPGPELIRIAIEGTSNPDVLDRWLDAALRAASLPDLLNGREDGRQQGILETARKYLLTVVQIRFQAVGREAIRIAVEGTNDPSVFERWFEAAMRAESLTDLLNMIDQPS
jgi:hypothetical protein